MWETTFKRAKELSECRCSISFEVKLGRSSEYRRFKAVLDAGKHPTFIGRQTVERHAINGGLLFFQIDGKDVAGALVNPRFNNLMVLNVVPEHRSHHLGSAIVRYLNCNFARVIQNKITFFKRLGYTSIGKMKKGRRFKTQIMVKSELIHIAGKLQKGFEKKKT